MRPWMIPLARVAAICAAGIAAVSSTLVATALAQLPANFNAARFDATPGALSKDVVPIRVESHIAADPQRVEFSGEVVHQVFVRKPTSMVELHARNLTIKNATVDGQMQPARVEVDTARTSIKLHFAQPIAVGNTKIHVAYEGKIGEKGEGLYSAPVPGSKTKKILATQMEPIGARDMLPCFDEPSFRTVWQMSVTSHNVNKVIGNMPVAKVENVSDKLTRTTFAPTPSMSSYLLALAVGEFDQLSDRYDGVELNIYTMPGKSGEAKQAMLWTKDVLKHLHDYFGTRYPLPKLDQITVPGKRGAMENWGLITYGEGNLLVNPATDGATQQFWSLNIIAHEIAHQWFGNLVTMAWWDDLWLNESFATWMANKLTHAIKPEWNAPLQISRERENAMAIDVLATAKPISRPVPRDAAAFDSFDAISYEKGASVLGMIEASVGEAAWRDALRTYMQRHAYGNTRATDLWASLAGPSAERVTAFAQSWTTQPGFPLIDVTMNCAAGTAQGAATQTATLAQSRYLLRAGYAAPQSWRVAALVGHPDGRDRNAVFLDTREQKITAGACGQPWLVDLAGNGYFRVRYDDAAFNALSQHFNTLAAADQQRLITDSWALAEAGLASPLRTFALLEQLNLKTSPEVWSTGLHTYEAAFALLRGSPAFAAAQAHARKVFAPYLGHIGWSARAGEAASLSSVRGEVIGLLAKADDAAVVAKARTEFAAWRAGKAGLTGDALSGAISAVGAQARNDDVDAMVAAIASGKYPTLEYTLNAALASGRDPEVAKYAVGFALREELPRTAAQRLVNRLARNAGHNAMLWNFTKEHKATLFERNSFWGRRYVVPAALANSRDVALAKEVAAMANAELEPDARLETEKAVEGVQRMAWAFEAIAPKIVGLK
jgi:aminopeptidase N